MAAASTAIRVLKFGASVLGLAAGIATSRLVQNACEREGVVVAFGSCADGGVQEWGRYAYSLRGWPSEVEAAARERRAELVRAARAATAEPAYIMHLRKSPWSGHATHVQLMVGRATSATNGTEQVYFETSV